MNCNHCYEPVPDGSPFCPKCGARLDAPLLGPPEAADPTYIDVARANLLRMRGDWDAAQASAIAVLRRYPNSPTAHSLLGDIFADQGRLEEAAQWYRMALDHDANSQADKRKLERVEGALRAESDRQSAAEVKAPPVSTFRILAIAAGVFLVGVIVAGFTFRWLFPGSSAPQSPRVPQTANQPTSAAPTLATAPGKTAPVAETERETFLLATLMSRSQEIEGRGLKLTAAIVDESGNRGLLVLDAVNVTSAGDNWPKALYDAALVAANSAMGVDRSLEQIAVRVVMDLNVQGQGHRREQAFIGTLDRTDVPESAAAPRFSTTWWRSGIKPPAEPVAPPMAPVSTPSAP